MKNVVTIIDGELRLCSGLGEYAFGKTNYNSVVTQKGLLAQCDSKPDEPLHFSFTPWTFQDIKSFDVEGHEERIVFFCAQNPFSKKAETLYSLFAKAGQADASVEDKDKMYEASFAVCALMTQAATEQIDIPVNGAGGIIVDGNNLLLLPHDIFVHSIAGLSNMEQADLHNCWINPSLSELPSLCFTRASFAYKMLTGRFAYPAADSLTRNADLLDKKFLPLELCVNGINEELAQAVNNGLKLNSNSINIPGKKQKGKKSEELVPKVEFPLELLKAARSDTSSRMSQEEFENKIKSFQKLQNSKINTRRTLRRNTTAFTVGIIAVIAVILIIVNSYKSYQDNYTTKGFTSTQTIQTFFKGMNNLDIPLIQNIISGQSANRYADSIGNVFVISKQRQSNLGDGGYLKPAKYFATVTDQTKNKLAEMYGATNIRIDGKSYDEYIDLPKNKDKPEPVSSEQGVTINKGDTSVHVVEYYLLYTDGDYSDINVTKNRDTFTLTFKKDKWVITDIDTSTQEIKVDSNALKTDYFTRVMENQGDVVKAIAELSLTYDFLPSAKDVKTEKTLIDEYIADPYRGLF
ncbi:MAG: hypothetical protein J5726_03280 [Treponema sp.]|nr:hypothetical protein [Treponema sp.]